MAHQRGHASAMDFEFQDKTGPVDARSPFAQVRPTPGRRLPLKESPSKKRGVNFDSTSSPYKPLPPLPAFNSLYNTPRKLNEEMIDDSSAGETPRSPADNSDATPDTKSLRSALSRFDTATMPEPMHSPEREKKSGGGGSSSPTKERTRPTTNSSHRRESFLGRIKNKLYYPGRGEIPRADYSQAMEKRIKKRRDRELHRHVARRRRHSVSDSGDDSELPPQHSSPRKTSGGSGAVDDTNKPHWLGSFFTFIAQHPTVPYVLSFYAQLLFNIFLLGCCAYLIYCFWTAVQGDVNIKSREAMLVVATEIVKCRREYQSHRCDQDYLPSMLVEPCERFKSCMEQDPHAIGRAKVSAHTFAQIFNSFIDPISYKAMIFTFILVFGCFAVSNMAFGFFREKTPGAGPPYQQYYGGPPPTPQRTFSNQDGEGFYGTPWHAPPVGLEPQPSAGFGQIEGRGSPVRRLVYN